MNRQLSRAIIGAGGCIGIGLAFQPLYSEPGLHTLAIQSGELLLRAGGTIAVTLASGYAIHRIKAWATERPVMPTASATYAALAHMPPQLQQVVAQAQADERMTDETDEERQWHNAIVRFCAIGQSRGSFGWHTMKHSVDRPGWDAITGALSRVGVIVMGSGRRPTLYAEGWDTVRLRVALKRGWLHLPYIDYLPVVRW